MYLNVVVLVNVFVLLHILVGILITSEMGNTNVNEKKKISMAIGQHEITCNNITYQWKLNSETSIMFHTYFKHHI
jgi:hypothetical protein